MRLYHLAGPNPISHEIQLVNPSKSPIDVHQFPRNPIKSISNPMVFYQNSPKFGTCYDMFIKIPKCPTNPIKNLHISFDVSPWHGLHLSIGRPHHGTKRPTGATRSSNRTVGTVGRAHHHWTLCAWHNSCPCFLVNIIIVIWCSSITNYSYITGFIYIYIYSAQS